MAAKGDQFLHLACQEGGSHHYSSSVTPLHVDITFGRTDRHSPCTDRSAMNERELWRRQASLTEWQSSLRFARAGCG